MPSLFFVAAAAAREGRSLGAADLARIVREDAARRHAARSHPRPLGARPAARAHGRARGGSRHLRRLRLLQAVAPERARPLVGPAHALRRPRRVRSARRRDHRARRGDRAQARSRDRALVPSRPAVSPSSPAAASSTCWSACCAWSRRRSRRSAAASTPSSAAASSTRWRRSSCASGATAASCPCATRPEAAAAPGRARGRAPRRARAEEPAALHRPLGEGARALPGRRCATGSSARWRAAARPVPAHFELAFGVSREAAPGEPHLLEPLAIDLGDGRTLRVSGKIDRIDRRPGRHASSCATTRPGARPRDDGGLFRGGRQLQIPFYILAAARMFPETPVVEAFLDYVDGGRQVGLDPALVRSDSFRALLRGLVDAIAQGRLRAGADRLRVVRLQGRVRAHAPAPAPAAAQARRSARPAGAAAAGRRRERSSPSTRTRASARAAITARASSWRRARARARRRCSWTASSRSCARARPAWTRSRRSPSRRTPPPR